MNNNNNKANWFIDQLNLYQSANSNHNSIRDNFVIRKAEFSRIINSLMDKEFNDPLQCELILGRRGSGKSTLLKRIEIEILENKSLNKKYIPINLAEEQAGIYRLFDLWEQVIEELSCRKSEPISLKQYSEFENSQEYTRYLYQTIHNTCLKDDKKIVLLLDNFDRIIENFTDDGNLLRETLINYNDIAIIAGSTRMDEYFWRYDMPFYEFFRRHRLEALNKHEISSLIQHWSNTLDLPELKDFETNNQGKIENIRILTDGLPRTLQFFIQMVLQNTDSTSYDYLNKIMDNVTPLYQERLIHLPAQLRKIVLEMAFIWEACNTKQLSEKCKMESKLISANLKTLIDKGIVDKIETSKKNHLYRISERFFNLWLIVTQGNPEQKRKAKWLSIFIENWYNSSDLKDLAQKHIAKLKTNQISAKEALIQSKALSQCKYVTTEQRDNIIELTKNIPISYNEKYLIELPDTFKNTALKIEKLIEKNKLDEALKIAESIENEVDGKKHTIIGFIYFKQSDFQNAEKHYKDAIQAGNEYIYLQLGLIKERLGKNNDAIKCYMKAISKGDTDAYYAIGTLYYSLKKLPEAEKYLILAKEHGSKYGIYNLAVLYESKGEYDKAKNNCFLSLEYGIKDAYLNLGNIFYEENDLKKSEEYFLLAIKSGIDIAIFNLAYVYEQTNNINEAKKYYLLAIEKGIRKAYFNLGYIYATQNKLIEAEHYFLLAIENGDIEAFFNLAVTYEKLNNLEEAEKYYSLAIKNGYTNAFLNLGILNQSRGKNDIAIDNFIQAKKSNIPDASIYLANLYFELGNFTKAEEIYISEIMNHNKIASHNLAVLYYKQNLKKEESLYYIKEYNKDTPSKIIIEIWNGVFNDIEQRANTLASESIDNFDDFIFDLFVHQQKALVNKLFNNQDFGTELQNKFNILYYVSLILNNIDTENVRLKIPPEIDSTINSLINQIEEKQKFYGYRI